MKIAPLTIQQYRSLQGQSFTSDSFFNPTAMADGTYFISEEEINAYKGAEFAWIKYLTLIDYSTDIPDTTPPQMTGYGVLIPQEVDTIKLFPNNQFNLNGFVINFTSTSQGLAVDLAYLGWQEFRDEQLNPINEAIKVTFTDIWDSVVQRYLNNEIIQL